MLLTDHARLAEMGPILSRLATPDAALIEFGSGGAQQLAVRRVYIYAGFLLMSAAFQLVVEPARLAAVVTAMAGFGLLVSLFVAWRVRARGAVPALPFIAATIDTSLVTGILVSFALAGQVAVAANSMFVWEFYLLVIVVSAMRFDLRVVLFAGGLVVAQWAGVLWWIHRTWGVPSEIFVGEPDIALAQGLRFLLIGLFTVGSGLLVERTTRLVRLSGSDALTGLANRALLDQRLVEEVASARRWARHLSVVFLDIDRFKQFNDHFGHKAGDEALRATARALIEECRESDVIARWGGEEFVLVLPDSAARDAIMVVERIRERLAVTPIPGVSPEARVTLSAGIAEFPTDGDEAGTLERRADGRLMVAKRRGRDRVVARD